MVRILIANAGSGKTLQMKRDIAGKCYGSKRETYIIEREDYPEYSDIFNGKSVHVLNSRSDISFMQEITNCNIYVDCEDYSDDLLVKIDHLCREARVKNNKITIAILDSDIAYIQNRTSFVKWAEEIYIGRCCKSNEQLIKTMFGENPKSLETDFILPAHYYEEKNMLKTLRKITWEDKWQNYIRFGQPTEPLLFDRYGKLMQHELPEPNTFAIIEVMAQLKDKMTVYEAYLKGVEAVFQLETDNQCGACKKQLIQLKKQEIRNLKKGIIDEELRDYIAAATRGYEKWLRNR